MGTLSLYSFGPTCLWRSSQLVAWELSHCRLGDALRAFQWWVGRSREVKERGRMKGEKDHKLPEMTYLF